MDNAELTDFLPWQRARKQPIDRAKGQVERLVREAEPSGPVVRPDVVGQIRVREAEPSRPLINRHICLDKLILGPFSGKFALSQFQKQSVKNWNFARISCSQGRVVFHTASAARRSWSQALG